MSMGINLRDERNLMEADAPLKATRSYQMSNAYSFFRSGPFRFNDSAQVVNVIARDVSETHRIDRDSWIKLAEFERSEPNRPIAVARWFDRYQPL